MAEIESLCIHSACMAGEERGYQQMKDRIALGFMPKIILKDPLKGKEVSTIEKIASEHHAKGISFDMGICTGARPLEDHLKIIGSVEKLIGINERYSKIIGAKLSSALAAQEESASLRSPITMEEYEERFLADIELMKHVSEYLQNRGLSLSLENRPRPNYSYSADSRLLKPDPQPRWDGRWSAIPRFIGTFFSSADEINAVLGALPGVGLDLDLEHLCQTVQWGNIFNLEISEQGVLRYGDLTDEQKESMVHCGLTHDDNDVLFDYKNLTAKEQYFLENFGFAIRKGEPLVYARQLFLDQEAELLKGVRITEITPGFQVYQGLRYVIDSEHEILTIGSHMPGIQQRYVKDPELVIGLSRKLEPIYALAWCIMERHDIGDILLEIQVDDTQKPVYEGEKWKEQAETAKRQALSLFRTATEQGFRPSAVPHYLTGSSQQYAPLR
jgi:hypothetical protein